jgi:hypothetical protein
MKPNFMPTIFSKIFLDYQPHHVVEWRINQRLKDHLRPRHQGTDDKDRDGP